MGAKATLLYDGRCGLCTGSVRWLRVLDWLSRVDAVDANVPAARAAFPQVDPERARAQVQLVPRPGAAPLEGFRAFRWLAGRLPALWGLWPWLWLPGAGAVGDRVYRAVARRRYRLAGGAAPGCGACAEPGADPGADPPVSR